MSSYTQQRYRDWYKKTKPQRHIWLRQYYKKHREQILEKKRENYLKERNYYKT